MLSIDSSPDKPLEYRLGHEVVFQGKKGLVVRICDSSAVFESRRLRYAVTELYVELYMETGQIEFVVLKRRKDDMPRPDGVTIMAPEPILWKDEDQIDYDETLQRPQLETQKETQNDGLDRQKTYPVPGL